jgi:hypothetical protein
MIRMPAMTPISRTMLYSALLIALTQAASAASMRYQGQLSDAGQPANGSYDIQIELYNAAAGGTLLDEPITFEDVQVRDGVFQLDLDAPRAAQNQSAWLQAAVRDGASSGALLPLSAREKVTLAPLIGACWSTTGDTGSNPAVNYLGNSDAQTLVLNSPNGVSINKRAAIANSTIDLLVGARSAGDADADLQLESRTGKIVNMFVRDSSNNFVFNGGGAYEFYDGVNLATQNAGAPVYQFSGRLRSAAAGTGATDTSGGLWLSDETPDKSYVGRGSNDANWTGIFAENTWRMTVADDGLFTINSLGIPGTLTGTDMVLTARPVGGDADSDLVWQTRSGKLGRIYLSDASGGFIWNTFNLTAGANFFSMSNGASLSNGGVWTNASSRELKEGFQAVDTSAMLDKVIGLPITTWTYKSSAEGTHIGPLAEDFKATFGLAGDGKAIATVDADGVALAAIQGLNAKLEAENTQLRDRLTQIEMALQQLQLR